MSSGVLGTHRQRRFRAHPRRRHGDVRKSLVFIGCCWWDRRHDFVMAMCDKPWFLRMGRSSRRRDGDVRTSWVFHMVLTVGRSSRRRHGDVRKTLVFHWFLMVGRPSRRRHGDVRQTSDFHWFLGMGRSSRRNSRITLNPITSVSSRDRRLCKRAKHVGKFVVKMHPYLVVTDAYVNDEKCVGNMINSRS